MEDNEWQCPGAGRERNVEAEHNRLTKRERNKGFERERERERRNAGRQRDKLGDRPTDRVIERGRGGERQTDWIGK